MTTRTEKSPSGRYTLTISSEATKPGCWDYTLGEVSRIGWEKIASIKRNYSSFPFLFIEDHPNGHDYLVCGEDYQGQTVIELDTGRRRDFLPEDAKQGHGFCWADYTFDVGQQMLTVDGCIWACPYEYRFYDFSDPMEKDWPQIEFENDGYAFAEGKGPTWNADGTITLWETRTPDDDEPSEEDPKPYEVASKTYRRDGLVFRLVSEWVDDKETVRRAEEAARRKAYDEAWSRYKETDPLFLFVLGSLGKNGLDPLHEVFNWSVGQCYEGWSPTFKGTDGTVNRRLVEKKDVKTLLGTSSVTLDLAWGREVAPVKLSVYRDGKGPDVHWFEHSIEGMTKALDLAASLLKT